VIVGFKRVGRADECDSVEVFARLGGEDIHVVRWRFSAWAVGGLWTDGTKWPYFGAPRRDPPRNTAYDVCIRPLPVYT